MAFERLPWILYHCVWTSRARKPQPLVSQMHRFVAECAVDPSSESIELSIYEATPDRVRRMTVGLESSDENVAKALEIMGPSIDPRVADAERRFGPGVRCLWASGASGFQFQHRWELRRPSAVAESAFLEFIEAHEGRGLKEGTGTELFISRWFELKRPGTSVPIFPESTLRSSVQHWVGRRHVSVALRYAVPEPNDDFRELHAEIVAQLAPPRPGVIQKIIPGSPGKPERTVTLR